MRGTSLASSTHPIRAAVYRAVQTSILRLFGTRRVIRGVPCSVMLTPRGVSLWQSSATVRAALGKQQQVVFDRIEAALQLLEETAPRVARRFRGDVQQIVVGGDERSRDAYCDPILGDVIVTARFAESDGLTPARLARLLVHEATHARVAHLGIEYKVGSRARIELACARQELAFIRAVPDAAELIAESEARVRNWAQLGEEAWSDERFHRDAREQLEANTHPKWLGRLLGRMLRPRAA
jgi:hypothetical protein